MYLCIVLFFDEITPSYETRESLYDLAREAALKDEVKSFVFWTIVVFGNWSGTYQISQLLGYRACLPIVWIGSCVNQKFASVVLFPIQRPLYVVSGCSSSKQWLLTLSTE